MNKNTKNTYLLCKDEDDNGFKCISISWAIVCYNTDEFTENILRFSQSPFFNEKGKPPIYTRSKPNRPIEMMTRVSIWVVESKW